MTEPTDPTERIPTTERVSRSERVEVSDSVDAERAWWQNAWLLLPLVLLLLLLLVGLLAVRPEALRVGGDDETTTTVGEDDEAVATTEPDVATTATTTATTQTTTTTTAERSWREVARLEGTSQKRGEVFTLPEGDARLRYESEADVFSVYVIDEGDSLDESGGAPEVTCTGECSDETRLAKGSGEYYLEVNSSGGGWIIVVEVLT